MVDVRGNVLRRPHGTTPAAVKANKIKKLSSFKSNENIHKGEDGSYYVVSANKAYFDRLCLQNSLRESRANFGSLFCYQTKIYSY